MKKLLIILIAIAFSIPAHGFDLKKQVIEYTLPNGMKWFFVRRTQAPVFSGAVVVRVGGADEQTGKTGVAHVFEHMSFKGSSRIGTRDFPKEKPLLDEIEKTGALLTEEKQKEKPDKKKIEELGRQMVELEKMAGVFRVKNEIWEILSRNGGADLNAYTSKDVTVYHSSMPVNRLKLWANVISDMIFDPVFREFYTERSVIAEERRSGTENNPDGVTSEKVVSAAFKDGPYHWSVIGFEKDIEGLTIADAREFHDSHYVPSNMVGVLVGDINIEEAKKVINETFGRYPKRPVPDAPKSSGTPKGGVMEKFSFNAEGLLVVAYHKPTLPDSAEYTFDVIKTLLCEGPSSRLQKRLVYEKRMAESIYCSDSFPGSRLPNLVLFWIEPQKGNTPKKILKEVNTEIERLKRELVSAKEMEKAVKNIKAFRIFGLEKNMDLARELAEYQAIFGDWRLLADYPERIEEVTSQMVLDTANKYLVDSNGVVVERVKK